MNFISEENSFNAAYINEKLAPIFHGKKSILKKYYKSLLDSLENGLIEIQNKVIEGKLHLEDMLIK